LLRFKEADIFEVPLKRTVLVNTFKMDHMAVVVERNLNACDIESGKQGEMIKALYAEKFLVDSMWAKT
jgi:hypothetical protein